MILYCSQAWLSLWFPALSKFWCYPCLVAHRLRTVIDYDRLIVLDRGQVRTAMLRVADLLTVCLLKIAEFDTPLNLISKENGIFRTMCLKSGTYSELEAAARAKADRDRQTWFLSRSFFRWLLKIYFMILVWSVVQQGTKFCRSSIIGVGYKILAVNPPNVWKFLNLRILLFSVRMERSGTGSAWATASISIDNHFLRSIKENIYIAIHKLCRDIPRWDTSPSNQSVTSWAPIHKMKNLECIVDYLILSETFLNSKMGSGPAY